MSAPHAVHSRLRVSRRVEGFHIMRPLDSETDDQVPSRQASSRTLLVYEALRKEVRIKWSATGLGDKSQTGSDEGLYRFQSKKLRFWAGRIVPPMKALLKIVFFLSLQGAMTQNTSCEHPNINGMGIGQRGRSCNQCRCVVVPYSIKLHSRPSIIVWGTLSVMPYF